MKIEDKRDATRIFPVVEILDEVVPLIDQKRFRGIRKIVLMDKYYRKGRNAAGRYVPVKNTRMADIELYFSHWFEWPDEAQRNKMYMTYPLTRTLAHELYHHAINGQKRKMKPKHSVEENQATRWGERWGKYVVEKLYPRSEYEEEYKEIYAMVEAWEAREEGG